MSDLRIDIDFLKDRIENEGKLIIRPSSIQQYIACPRQWALVHLMQQPDKPKAASNAGTSLHKAAEVGYQDKIKLGQLPPVSFLKDAAVEEWQKVNDEAEEHGGIQYDKGESYQSFEDDIVEGVEAYHREIMPLTDAVAVEERFTVNLDHPVMEAVSGSIDIRLERGLADIKFTKRKTAPHKYVLQQSTYAFLMEANGYTTNFAEIHNVIRGKNNSERLALPLKKDYAKFWINKILDDTETFLETGDDAIFRGTNPYVYFLCSDKWCAYYNKCEFTKDLR